MSNQVKIKVKTLWRGCVAVHEKYYSLAVGGKGIVPVDLVVAHAGRLMTIPAGQARALAKGKSTRPFLDKSTGKPYWLVYYKWNPDPEINRSLFA